MNKFNLSYNISILKDIQYTHILLIYSNHNDKPTQKQVK